MAATAGNTKAQADTETTQPQFYLGRQPIFDRDFKIAGYELLYRSGETGGASFQDGDAATLEVVLSAFLEIGMTRLVGEAPAFINAPRRFLLSDRILALPPQSLVVEILEDTEIDDALVDRVVALGAKGYVIALDDFEYSPAWEPLIAVARMIKIDVMALGLERTAEAVETLRPRGLQLLAEKVETQEEFSFLRDLGFDFFQGYFLAKPKVVSGRRLPSNKLATMRLLARVNDPESGVPAVEESVSLDIGLSYKLLRLINSSYFGMSRTITSIREAVVYLGMDTVRRWVNLMALGALDDKPQELLRCVLIRAKMCELLCDAGRRVDGSSGFAAGLFSGLDAFMDQPLGELLDELPLSDELRGALETNTGDLGRALHCTLAYERGEWDAVTYLDFDEAVIAHSYVAAVDWASEVFASF